jgi:AraC-like DNA-binding protein
MINETTQKAPPTATGFAARQAIAAVRKRKIAVEPLLQRAGLSEGDVESQRRICAIAQSKLLEYAAEALGDSAFGLHLAQQTNPREARLLFYVTSAATNVGDTIALFARYCRIVNEAVDVKLSPAQNEVIVEFNFVGLPRHHALQSAEFTMAVTLKGLRELVGRRVRPTKVAFAHTRNAHRREFERFFGGSVEFGAMSDQVSMSNETLALPLVTGDPHLLETLRSFCDEAARERHTPAETLKASVENEVQKLLPNGPADRRAVARALCMSERTLSRKLADEGATYAQVVDQLRRSLALQYVKERSLSLSQISWLLGYEGSTSFNHAFRRWTGRSPSTARSDELRASAQVRTQSAGMPVAAPSAGRRAKKEQRGRAG